MVLWVHSVVFMVFFVRRVLKQPGSIGDGEALLVSCWKRCSQVFARGRVEEK